jgi:hypothetical protein
MANDKVIMKGVSLYKDQWDIVNEVDLSFDFRNNSTALRHIINQHPKLVAENERLQQANARLRERVVQLAKIAGIDTLADLEQVSLQELLSPTF